MSVESRRPALSFDEALAIHLAEHGWTRRQFLARMAYFGAAATLAPVLAACGVGSASPTLVPATPNPTGTAAPNPTATPQPTPVPTPEKELFLYNWDGYIGQNTVAAFETKYGIKVRYDLFPDEATQIAKIQSDGKGGGYDVTYPASTWLPTFIADKTVQAIDASLIPNLANLAPDWRNPGYDPGNKYSVPNYWWTTGYAWNPSKVTGDPTSWSELWEPTLKGHLAMLDDVREVFAAAAFRLNLSPNTTAVADLDRILSLLQEQKPLVRIWTEDDIGDLTSGQVWITHAWSGDWYQMIADKPGTKYVIPSEGSIKGSDTMVILSGAPHPIAAHLWINYNLQADVSAANSNYIGYMGPNEAATSLIDPLVRDDPRLNPPADVLAKLVELAYLPPADLSKYTDRWNLLRA